MPGPWLVSPVRLGLLARRCRSAVRAATTIIPASMKNIVILISGGGSNMAAILRAAQRDDWHKAHGARVAAVISNRADAGGLAIAREKGVACDVVDHKQFESRDAFDAELARRIDSHAPALV